SSLGADIALSRAGRFMVSVAPPSLLLSRRSVVIGDSSGISMGWRSWRRREAPHVCDECADLRVAQMTAESGHAWLAARRSTVLDEIEYVVVRELGHGATTRQVSRPNEEERRAPRAMSVGAVAGRAVGEICSLHGRGGLRDGVGQEQEREDGAAEQQERG